MMGIRSLVLAAAVASSAGLASGDSLADGAAQSRGVVQAPSSTYVEIFGGVPFGASLSGTWIGGFPSKQYAVSVPLTNGYAVGGAVGVHLTPEIRGELELSYAVHGADGTGSWKTSSANLPTTNSGSYRTLSVLGNMWADLNIGGPFTPYLGGGVGAAVLLPAFKSASWTYDFSDTAFAAQVGGGVRYQLGDSIGVDLGYRAKGIFGGVLGGQRGLKDVREVEQTVLAGVTFGTGAILPAMDVSGAYFSAFAGGSLGPALSGLNRSVDLFNNPTQSTLTFPLNNGYLFGGALGTHLLPNLRAELEVSRTVHNVDGTGHYDSVATPFDAKATGSEATLYALGNLWYDVNVGGGITPYIGGGIGAAVLQPAIVVASSPVWTFKSGSTALAAQLGLGFKVPVGEKMDIDVGYRAKGVFNGGVAGSPTPVLTGVRAIEHTVQAGLTLAF